MKRIENKYINIGDYTLLVITSNKFGVFNIKIDNDIVDKCKEHHWLINTFNRKTQRDYFYVISNQSILLHRFIMNAKKGMVVDHINGDTLDNRRRNLQVCFQRENLRKQRKRISNKSGTPGVFWCHHLPTPKWKAFIKKDGVYKHLGYFNTYDEAVSCRLKYEKEYFGDFAPSKNQLKTS